MKIGIFDSGIGGLSILKEISKIESSLNIYYYADTENSPYGSKSNEFIISRCVHIVEEFIKEEISLIVVGCNTATAVAIEFLRLKFPDLSFVGVEPYINIINKRTELQSLKGVILATPLTGNSTRFISLKNRLDPLNILDVFTPVNLAAVIEKNFFLKGESYQELIDRELDSFNLDYDYYILGCTHYPLIKKRLERKFPGEMISPCPMVASRVKSLIGNSLDVRKQSFFYFYQSGIDKAFRKLEYSEVFNSNFD